MRVLIATVYLLYLLPFLTGVRVPIDWNTQMPRNLIILIGGLWLTTNDVNGATPHSQVARVRRDQD
jgi:hypothetical protein